MPLLIKDAKARDKICFNQFTHRIRDDGDDVRGVRTQSVQAVQARLVWDAAAKQRGQGRIMYEIA